MTRCPEGHFYDPAKHNGCPWCALPADTGGIEQKTRPVATPPPIPGGMGAPLPPPPPLPPVPGAIPQAGPPPGATVRVGAAKAKFEPVVGWLVCLEGPDRGKDYRLHNEKNYIGRSPSMDVVIESDNTVSRERHGLVIFDPKKQTFWALPGDAAGLVYLNGEIVNAPTRMKGEDVLEIGRTKLVLMPFCGGKYSWAEAES